MTTTFTKEKARGTNRTAWNVDRNGEPFGQIWTFKAQGEAHPFHAKTLSGEYEKFPTLADAKAYMVNA